MRTRMNTEDTEEHEILTISVKIRAYPCYSVFRIP